MIIAPLMIGTVAWHHENPKFGLLAAGVSLLGAVFVFHPDTIGWKLSLNGLMVKGDDPGPSHIWQVWARMSGLLLLISCAVLALTYSPPAPSQNACHVNKKGFLICK